MHYLTYNYTGKQIIHIMNEVGRGWGVGSKFILVHLT
jgi:hypothetical protein